MVNQLLKIPFHRLFFATLLLMLAGCANVHFQANTANLGDKALVFGKIVLVRDGEESAINAFSTPITISRIGSNQEPLMITEPFESTGRFYWTLPTGVYMLNITLNQHSGDVVSLAFEVEHASRAYYFGDIYLSGKKRFNTIGGANIKDVSIKLDDHFQDESAELIRRNPALTASIGKLQVSDASNDETRQSVLRKVLDSAPLCCEAFGGARFEKLSISTSKVFEIGKDGMAFQFPEGKSYYAAFELPAYSSPYAISLRSLVSSSGSPGRFRVFNPAVILLDEQFAIVEKLPSDLMHPVAASIFPPRAASMNGEVSISHRNAQARYLILYTTDLLLGASQATTIPGMLPVAGGAVPTGIPQRSSMEPWVTGRVEISLSPRTR